MPLPALNSNGELPAGVHGGGLEEVFARFGTGSAARRRVTGILQHIYELATRTNQLERFIIFGSYVTNKHAPNDVDVILIMEPNFDPEDAPGECVVLFDHARAQNELGASVFWVTDENIIGMTVDEFIRGWQLTRDNTLRGIVEITQ